MSETPLVQALTRGKAEVQHGWTHGTEERMVFGRRTVCAYRALKNGMVDPVEDPWHWDHQLWKQAQSVFLEAIHELYPTQQWTDVSHIWIWNDEPGRTKAEVLEAYDRALKIAERDAPIAERAG